MNIQNHNIKIPGIFSLKVKGSILEPVIALMIIVFSLTASLLVVMKANYKDTVQQQVRALAATDTVYSNTFLNSDYLDKEWKQNGLDINKECKWYDTTRSLLDVRVSVFDSKGKLLVERNKVITVNDADKK